MLLEGFDKLPFELHPENLDADTILKAYTPGTGIVQAGETTPAALRAQVLDPLLVASLYGTQDARFLQLLYLVGALRADSVAYEYTNMEGYGRDQEAFINDIGASATAYATIADQVYTADDVYQRYVKNSRFLGARRIVSLSAALSRSVVNPMVAAMVGATNELVGKANAAIYWANPAVNAIHWEGVEFQLMNAYFRNLMTEPSVTASTITSRLGARSDTVPVMNMDGKSLADATSSGNMIAEPVIQEASARIVERFGNPQFLLVPPRIMQQIAAALTAKERLVPSLYEGVAAIYANIIASSEGMPIQLVVDRLMQPGRSLIPHKSLALASEAQQLPSASRGVGFGTVTAAGATVQGTAVPELYHSSWNNMSGTVASLTPGASGIYPAIPTSYLVNIPNTKYIHYRVVLIGHDGVRLTNTVAVTYTGTGANNFIVVSGTVTGAQDSQYDSNGAVNPAWYKGLRVKVYRSPITSSSTAPSDLNLYKYVGDAGVFNTGSGYAFFLIDSGFISPIDPEGTVRPKVTMPIFLLTIDKPPYWNTRFLQFLPLMQRQLPSAPLADQFAYLLFGTPIVRVPGWCAIIYNVAWTFGGTS